MHMGRMATVFLPYRSGMHPLTGLTAMMGEHLSWAEIHYTVPEKAAGWIRCSDVDNRAIAEWEKCVTTMLTRDFHQHHALASASYVLDWYAGIPSYIGGLAFGLARRVPRLDRQSLAFHRHPTDAYPDGIALLASQFWCLPEDSASQHPDATVVDTEEKLAEIVRGQVRAHADDFLSSYRSGSRLPRRHLVGAFFDGLDTGVRMQSTEPADETRYRRILRDARLVLPGAVPEFADATTLELLQDDKGRQHLTRKRISCCFYFKVSEGGIACATCPRTSPSERLQRLSDFADQQL